jgi:predicted small secreted protein
LPQPEPIRSSARSPPDNANLMETPMKALIPALLMLMTLTACETMEGLGRDVENTGETLTQESKEAQVGM